jgi:hypothetical protein
MSSKGSARTYLESLFILHQRDAHQSVYTAKERSWFVLRDHLQQGVAPTPNIAHSVQDEFEYSLIGSVEAGEA